jgi:hypothetical protein
MKNWALFAIAFWMSVSALACDSYLQFPQKDPRQAALFKKDCELQDRYQTVRTYFESLNINVAELLEYRILRFVDRSSYESAKANELHPSQIYKPAPMTWEVWDTGIRSIFGDDKLQNTLFITNGFDSAGLGFDHLTFTNFNAVLLKNQMGDVSRDKLINKSVRNSAPGTFRQAGDGNVGWTSLDTNIAHTVNESQQSMRAAQKRWEELIGASFSTVVARHSGLAPQAATFSVPMSVSLQTTGTPPVQSYFVNYAPDNMVMAEISWLSSFIKENLDRYRKGNPVMPPIQLAAIVQKWLVTIHPFSDGNGRTSRAAQDVILANFKMPYAPAGDLQNDVLEKTADYVDKTYSAIELMVKKLESCAEEYRLNESGARPSYGCRTARH